MERIPRMKSTENPQRIFHPLEALTHLCAPETQRETELLLRHRHPSRAAVVEFARPYLVQHYTAECCAQPPHLSFAPSAAPCGQSKAPTPPRTTSSAV